MQRSVINWDEVQMAPTPSPSPILLTTGRATATPTRGFTPGHLLSDGNMHLPQEVPAGNRRPSTASSL